MPEPVKKIGNYELLEPMVGGTHSLYKAKGPDDKLYALKTIPLGGAPELVERFQREVEIAKQFDHPNLVKIVDSGSTETQMYLVMELLDGMDLRKILARKMEIPWEQRISIMEQICDGLAYAHQKGMVHRDIKPANLFLEFSGKLRILDFGMARVQDSKLTRAGIALGTLNYMAPEQVRGQKCTAASDVFACGVVFYELSTGQHPFSSGAADLKQILFNLMSEDPPPLQLASDAPAGLEMVLAQVLEKDPVKRLQNASEVKGLLRFCRQGLQQSAAPAVPQPLAQPAPPPKSNADKMSQTRKIVRPKLDPIPQPIPQPEPQPAPPAPTPVVAPDRPKPAIPRPVSARGDFVYCSNCTSPNSKKAAVCSKCGLPLSGTAPKSEAASVALATERKQLMIFIGIAAIALLVLVLLWKGLS